MFDGGLQTRRGCVLAIGSHPDDAVLGAGGLLAQLSSIGHRVILLTLSSGELGGDPALREAEETEAARRLGAAVEFGRLRDGNIDVRDAISVIDRAVQRFQPVLALTHSPQDTHQDHLTAHRAAIVACRRTPNLLSYESPSSLAFHPTVTLDVSAAWQRKLHAMAAFESQLSSRPLLAWIDAAGRYRAWPRHVGSFCEGLLTCHSAALPMLLGPGRGDAGDDSEFGMSIVTIGAQHAR